MNGMIKWFMIMSLCTIFALDCIFLLSAKASAAVVCQEPANDLTSNVTDSSKQIDIQFTDSLTNSSMGWLWDFIDGGINSIQNQANNIQIRN